MSVKLRPPAGVTHSVSARSLRTRALPQVLALAAGDVLSGVMAHGFVNLLLTPFGYPHIDSKVTAGWLLLWLFWRGYQGLYPGYGQSPQTELRRHTVSTVQVGLAQLAAAIAVRQFVGSSLEVMLVWLVVLVLALPVRYGVRSLLIRIGQWGRPVSIIGAGQTARTIVGYLLQHPNYGLRPVAAYDDNPALQGATLDGVPVVGDIDRALSDPRTEQAIISIPSAQGETQWQIVNNVYAVFPRTWTVPDLVGVPNQAMQPHNIGSLASLEIRNNLRSLRSQFVKRAIDIFGSTIGIILIFPFLLIIALIVGLDSSGPVIYKASRLGSKGKDFPCYKFRSMFTDADDRLEILLSENDELRTEYMKFHKLRNDPRVTRVGSFLRKTSADELPQLFNVFMGQMSLVGPRPYLLRESEKMGNMRQLILSVKPGMTGYWQVNDRNESTFNKRLEMDRFYITNWSPWLDITILLQTVSVVILKKGAY